MANLKEKLHDYSKHFAKSKGEDDYSEILQPSLSELLQYIDKWERKLNDPQLEFAGTDPELPKISKPLPTE